MIDQTDFVKILIGKIDAELPVKGSSKLYGLAEVINGRDNEVFPVTIPLRTRINPKDTWKLQTYHRQLNSQRGDTSMEFGLNKKFLLTIRHVVIADPEFGEDYIYHYLNDWPDQVATTGAYGVILEPAQIEHDHMAIAAVEFGQAWEDKHRLTKNFWAVQYVLEVTLSPECVVEE